jgi:hypothetical protein
MHTFLKIRRPVDIPGPLESEFPIIPVLYVGNDRYTLARYFEAQLTLGCTDIEIQQAPHQEVLPQIYRGTPRVCTLNPHIYRPGTHRIVLAYLRDLTHSFALCDRDMVRIVGKWYRCAFCAKDLCADCEALDSHDDTHVFLVFKAPVDMHAFRCAVPFIFRISSLMPSCSQ